MRVGTGPKRGASREAELRESPLGAAAKAAKTIGGHFRPGQSDDLVIGGRNLERGSGPEVASREPYLTKDETRIRQAASGFKVACPVRVFNH
jgi:hypothetical protein